MIGFQSIERARLDAGSNTYCIGGGGAGVFAIDNARLDFASWKANTGVDLDSIALPADAGACRW